MEEVEELAGAVAGKDALGEAQLMRRRKAMRWKVSTRWSSTSSGTGALISRHWCGIVCV